MTTNQIAIGAALALLVGTGLFAEEAHKKASMPQFQVDPFWPKMPPKTMFGVVAGVNVDAKDHVWVIHRPATLTKDEKGLTTDPPGGLCCKPAPPVMEFDNDGNFIQGWGGPGPGYEWPLDLDEHGIFVDYKDHVWIGAGGGANSKVESQILKFTRDGRFLMQIGHRGQSKGSNDPENLREAADMYVWPKTNELFVADGYGNRRVIVYDADTGAYKRHWGAYGNKPDDSVSKSPVPEGPGSPQFNTVHHLRLSSDGMVYVADRRNDRVQVFTLEGKFLKEVFIARDTKVGTGTVFSISFSADPQQKYMYVVDLSNAVIWILNRQTLDILGSFGQMGHYAGQFIRPHNSAVDSKGNLYVTEATEGRRVQKFLFKGVK